MPALNTYLYNQLTEQFGTVLIASQGEAFLAMPGTNAQSNVVQAGEYYRVNCPYCRDTRQRLWVNHMWGIPDEHNNAHWWAVWCYNDTHCMKYEANRKDLITRVYKAIGRDRRCRLPVARGHIEPTELCEVRVPGDNIVPLTSLHPSHPAIYYLANQRGFDPEYLEKRFGVGWVDGHCEDYRKMTDRIYIPVYQNGQLVFWQGRVPSDDMDWRLTEKYWGRRNVAKRKILYNYDVAKTKPWGMLVEGVTDVWRMGDHAFAMLGDNLSPPQVDMILAAWRTLVVLVDNERAYYNSEDAFTQLRYKGVTVVRVDLPEGADPASVDNDFAWDLIDGTCSQQGVDLLGLMHT